MAMSSLDFSQLGRSPNTSMMAINQPISPNAGPTWSMPPLGEGLGMLGEGKAASTGFGGLDSMDMKSILGLGIEGAKVGASLWDANNMNQRAKEQLAFTKEFANANLTNQIKSYNTALEDRIRARYGVEGKSQEQADAYVSANKLSR